MARESNLERRFVKAIQKLGWQAIKIYMRGWPDRLVILPGKKVVWVELKAPGEKARPHQVRVHRKLRQLRHTVIVFDGSGWVRMFAYLRGLR